MTETAYINLTYISPHEDIEKSLGLNSDGTVNAKYTLICMKELLTNNLLVINKLLDEVNNIVDITPVGYGIVEIKVKSEVIQKLLDDNILITHPIKNENSDESNTDEWSIDDTDETNQDRLNMISNLINQDDSQNIFGSACTSDAESEAELDDIINDEKNAASILNKYCEILIKNGLMDNSDYSDNIESSDSL